MSRNVNDIILKYKKEENRSRLSSIYLDSASILSLSQTDISGISEEGFSRDQAFLQIKSLKDKVVDLLVNYQKELSLRKNNFKQVKSQLTTETLSINQEYGILVVSLKQYGILPGEETAMVMNIIEDFISKFGGLLTTQINRYSFPEAIIQETIPQDNLPKKTAFKDTINTLKDTINNQQKDKTAPKDPINNQQKESLQSLDVEVSNFLQISNISHINFALHEDTFYNATSVTQINSRLHSKIERLKTRLEKILHKEQLVNTRQILKESIDDLNAILAKNELKDIKRIVYKMEQTVQKLSDKNIEGSDALNLYNLLQKAIKFSKKKEKLSGQSQVSQEQKEPKFQSSSQQAQSPQYPPTAFMKRPPTPKILNKVQAPKIILGSSQKSAANFKNTRTQINSDVIQNEFLHLCLRLKAQLPLSHSGRRLLIFQLYDQVVEEDIKQPQWVNWITHKLNS